MQKTIFIPTLNDGRADFQFLFDLCNRLNDSFENVLLDFSRCSFLRPNALTILGGLTRLLEYQCGNVVYDWDSIKNQAVLAILMQNGFAEKFGLSSHPWDGSSIPYREDLTQDMNEILDYLNDHWLGKGWVKLTHALRDIIIGKKWEIYNNAFEHSASPVGVFSCGQHFPNQNDLVLSVVDFGVGIPTSVRSFFKTFVASETVDRISDAECLKWAFRKGNTTKCDIARGLGLDFLKSFIAVNHGKLEVYSNAGYVIVDDSGERHQNCPVSFPGTVVHITLRCDENIYTLSSEQTIPF